MQSCINTVNRILSAALLLLLPCAGLLNAQEVYGKKIPAVKEVAAIPLIQSIIVDSVRIKYGLNHQLELPLLLASFDTSGNQSHKNLFHYFEQKAGLKQWKGIITNAKELSPVKGGVQQLLSLLPGIYALKNKSSLQQYNPFTTTSFQVHETVVNAVTGNQFGLQRDYASVINTGATLTIAGVPLSGTLQTGYPTFFNQQPAAMFKFSFDETGFEQKLRQNLNDRFDLKKYALSGFDFEQILKNYTQSFAQNISREFSNVKELEPFMDRLKNLSPEEILYLNIEQLEEKIFTSSNSATPELNGNLVPDSLQQLITNCKSRIREMKQQFGQKGIDMNALVRYQQLLNNNIDSLTSSSAFISSTARELLPMSGLSRLFTKMKSFNAGQFASGWSEKTLSGIFMSGIGGDFQGKQLFTGVNVFENRPLAPIRDNQFSKVLDQPNQFIQAIRIGNGDINNDHTHVTAANAKTFNRNWPGNNQLLTMPRNTFAGTISKQTNLGKAGIIEAEISKSSSALQNGVTDIDGRITETVSAFNGFLQDFWQTLSVGISYQNQYEQIGFEHQLSFNYSGLGYNNPSTGFNSRGLLQGEILAKKSFYKNKGLLQVRYQRRNNYTGTESNQLFRQDRLNVVAKWKFNKKLKGGLSWNSAVMQRANQAIKTSVFEQVKGTFNASYQGKVGGRPLLQYVTAGYQHFSFIGNAGELPGEMLLINSSTNLSAGKVQMQMNIQYMHDAGAASIRRSLFSSDAGIGFSVQQKIRITSSLTWLSQTDAVKQLGVRNAIEGHFGKKWQISVFGDLRKNLVENQNAFFFPAVRGEIMVHYLIQ